MKFSPKNLEDLKSLLRSFDTGDLVAIFPFAVYETASGRDVSNSSTHSSFLRDKILLFQDSVDSRGVLEALFPKQVSP